MRITDKVVLINVDRMRGIEPLMRSLREGGLVEDGTLIEARPNLPEEDEQGRPILAFLVDCGRVWAWRGEPILMPEKVDG